MNHLGGNSHRYSLSNNSYLDYRSSGLIAHRLSVYMPSFFPPSKNPQKFICELNARVTAYREMLIKIGQSKDNPELRKEIRKSRQICMEASQLAVNEVTSFEENTERSTYVTLLLCLLQLFSKELIKSYRLIQIIPLDMSEKGNLNKHVNFGSAIGQILLRKEIKLDFNQEELSSIQQDVKSIDSLMAKLEIQRTHGGDPYENTHDSLASQTGGTKGLRLDVECKVREGIRSEHHLLCCMSRRQ